VLNTQQNVFQTRRDLAQAYFNYLIGVLRLKSAVGTLSEQDLEEINRRLQG
jgi:outer membrane protein